MQSEWSLYAMFVILARVYQRNPWCLVWYPLQPNFPCCQCCVNGNPDLSQSLTHYDTSRCCQLIPRTLQRTAIRFGFRGIFSVKLRTQNFLYFWQLESGTKVNFLFLQPGDLVPWFVTASTSHCTKVSTLLHRLTIGGLKKSKSFWKNCFINNLQCTLWPKHKLWQM